MRWHRRWAATAAALGLLLGTLARAEVDVEVPVSVKAKGTISDAAEVDTFRFAAWRNAKVAIKCSAVGGADLDFDIALLDGSGEPVEIDASFVKDQVSRVAIAGFPLPATDSFRVDVSATGTGDYSFSLKGVPSKKWATTLSFAGAGPVVYTVAAPPGSTLQVSAKPAKGSPALPSIDSVVSGTYAVPVDVPSKKGAQSASVVLAGGNGEYDLSITNEGGDGDVALLVKVKPPKVAASKLDLRGPALGRPAGGETFLQRTVGTAGGTMAVADAGSDLFGAALVIPAGALTSEVPISMGSAESVEPPSGTDQAAGPAVDLQPSGTTFAMPVQVTLPYEDALLPADATPADIQVLIVEEDGTSQVVPPLSVDAGAGTVTVETSGFSVCVPVVEKGPPRLGLAPGGDEYWVAQVFASFQTDGNDDSRARAVSIESGEASFFSNGTFQFGVDESGFSWSNSDLGGGTLDGTPIPSFQSFGGGGTWSYNADGQTITLSTGDPDSPVMRVSEDGCLMVGRSETRSSTDGETLILLRKPTSPVTEADVAGTYRVVGLECEAAGSSGGPADIALGRFSGTFVFKADGTAKLTLDRRGADFDGSSFAFPLERIVLNGSFYVDAAGSLFFYAPDPEQPEGFLYLDLDVGCGTDAMVGSISTLGQLDIAVLLLVRQSTGRSRSDLDGEWIGVAHEMDPQSYGISPPGVSAPDFHLGVEALTASFDGGSTATLGMNSREIARDSAVAGGVRMADVQDSFPLSVTVASTGSFSLAAPDGGVEGGIAPGGTFAFFTTRTSDATGSFLLGALVKPPPKKN